MSKRPVFDNYVCDGDTITWNKDGYEITARIEHDDSNDKPDERDDGFWPSLDPRSAGFIGVKSGRTLDRHMAWAREIMDAWTRDEWWYVGVCVTVSLDGVELTGEYDYALWGIECNYPTKGRWKHNRNTYLTETARELATLALQAAKAKLDKLAKVHLTST